MKLNLYDADRHGPLETDKDNTALLNAARECIIYLLEVEAGSQSLRVSDAMLITSVLGQIGEAIGERTPPVIVADRKTTSDLERQANADYPEKP